MIRLSTNAIAGPIKVIYSCDNRWMELKQITRSMLTFVFDNTARVYVSYIGISGVNINKGNGAAVTEVVEI